MGFQHPPEGHTISPGEGGVVELLLVPEVVEVALSWCWRGNDGNMSLPELGM